MNLHLVREDEPPMGIVKLAYGMEQALKDFYELINAVNSRLELKETTGRTDFRGREAQDPPLERL